MNKLVSVIIPVYNVSEYIEESIDSILNQSYENIEVIIVDDCSTDNTYDLLLSKYANNSKVFILRNSSNSKIVYSLNKALKHSKGDYIARMDGDDIADKYRIEKQLTFLDDNPDFDLVGCSVEGINEKGEHLGYTYFPKDFELLKKIAPYSSPVSHIWLAKRDVYLQLGGYRFSSVEDYDFLLRMITSGFKFSNLDDYYGMKIRHRTGNTVSLFGVSQRKAFNFVRNRYFERIKNKDEKIKEEDFFPYILNSKFNYIHKLSNTISLMAIRNKAKIIKYPLYILSALLSPYQCQYLIYRYYTVFLMKKDNRDGKR